MRFVVADIHGEDEKLERLLGHIGKCSPSEVIFLGDYWDKGRGSCSVINILKRLAGSYKCHFLRGNHEHMFIRYVEGDKEAQIFLMRYGFRQTAESYLKRRLDDKDFQELMDKRAISFIPADHIAFVMDTVDYYLCPDFIVVHAGMAIDQNGNLSLKDREKLFFSRREFLEHRAFFENRRIIFGHTAFPKPFYDGFKIGIDTGAAYAGIPGYGRLSALNVEKLEILNDQGERYPIIENMDLSHVRKSGNV